MVDVLVLATGGVAQPTITGAHALPGVLGGWQPQPSTEAQAKRVRTYLSSAGTHQYSHQPSQPGGGGGGGGGGSTTQAVLAVAQ